MKYIATIEIPKNSDRRIHKGNEPDNFGIFTDFGPLIDKIKANNGRMPLAYGFINGTTGTDGEGDEVDVMIFSDRDLKTEDTTEITPFAMMVREDGDFKVLAHDDTIQIGSWDDVPADMQKILMDFNGFKLPITEIKDTADTVEYIQKCVKMAQ